MNWETLFAVLGLFIGGSGFGGFVSAYFTRKSEKESTEIDLLDRAYKEINRLDTIIDDLEEELKKLKGDNRDLRTDKRELKRIIDDLKEHVRLLKRSLAKYEKEDE